MLFNDEKLHRKVKENLKEETRTYKRKYIV
jgi:hypothetical protein